MPTAKEHLRKLVIATSNGKKLGKIKDVYFDSKVTQVTAVSLESYGFIRRFIRIRRKKLMIEIAKVQTCGVDAWLVSNSDVVVAPKNVIGYADFVPASELEDRRIVTEGGTEIATVDSVILDDDCNVKGFTLHKLPESGPLALRKAIAREAISSIGSDTSPMTTTMQNAESIVISP